MLGLVDPGRKCKPPVLRLSREFEVVWAGRSRYKESAIQRTHLEIALSDSSYSSQRLNSGMSV